MVGTFVRLLCPECGKDWEMNPTGLPVHHGNYSCRSCGTTRRTVEFMRAERNLQTFKQFE